MKKKNQLNPGLQAKERMSLRKRLLIIFLLFVGAMSTVYVIDARIQAASDEDYEEEYEDEEEYDEKTEKEFDKYKGDWYARIDDGIADGLNYFIEYHIHISDVTKEDGELILRGDGHRSPTLDKATLNTSLLSYPTDEIPDVLKEYKNNGTMDKLFHFTNSDILVYIKETQQNSAKFIFWDADAQQKVTLSKMTKEEVEERKGKHEEWLATFKYEEEERKRSLSIVSEANSFIFGKWVGVNSSTLFTFTIQEINQEIKVKVKGENEKEVAEDYFKGRYNPDDNSINFDTAGMLMFLSETEAEYTNIDSARNYNILHLEKQE